MPGEGEATTDPSKEEIEEVARRAEESQEGSSGDQADEEIGRLLREESDEETEELLDKWMDRIRVDISNRRSEKIKDKIAEGETPSDAEDVTIDIERIQNDPEYEPEVPEVEEVDLNTEDSSSVVETAQSFLGGVYDIAKQQKESATEFVERLKEGKNSPLSVLGDAFESGVAEIKKAGEEARQRAKGIKAQVTDKVRSGFDVVAGFLESNQPATFFTKDEYTLPGELSSEEEEKAEETRQREQQKKKELDERMDELIDKWSSDIVKEKPFLTQQFDRLQDSLQNIFENPEDYKTPQEEIEEITEKWLEENNEDLDKDEKAFLTEKLDIIQDYIQNFFEGDEYTLPEELTSEKESTEITDEDIISEEPIEESSVPPSAPSESTEEDIPVLGGENIGERISKEDMDLIENTKGIDGVIEFLEEFGEKGFKKVLKQIKLGEEEGRLTRYTSYDPEELDTLKTTIATIIENNEGGKFIGEDINNPKGKFEDVFGVSTEEYLKQQSDKEETAAAAE